LRRRSTIDPTNVDASFLLQRLQTLPTSTKQFLAISAAIGPTFDVTLVSSLMDHDYSDEESSGSSGAEHELSRSWVSGLHYALSDGMIESVRKIHLTVGIN
jgi:hypothetical protein